jgi:plastocyanin
MYVRGLRLPVLALVGAVLALGARSAAQAPRRATAAEGGIVRGRVVIGFPVHSRRAVGTYASRSLPVTPLAPPSEVENVVVYLKDAPARATAPIHAEIRQQQETFVPHVVAVPVGSTVDFPNDDPFYHNVFSLSKAKSFNLGRYPKGESRPVKFDKPGIVKVFCDIHSHMSATVYVFENPWYAIPSDDGQYELSGVPPGDHEVVAWHERLGDTILKVHVDAGRPATVDFTLPVPPK